MPRPSISNLSLPWFPADPCPVHPERQYGSCCGQHKPPRISIPSLVPPGPLTGKSNAGCYLRDTRNCSDNLSCEHYISRNVLERLPGDSIKIEGLPWIPEGEHKILKASSLTAKVLCERHNNALSPIDAIGGLAIEQISRAFDHASRRSLSEKSQWYLISGDGLELWLLKTLAGMYEASLVRANGQRLKGRLPMPHLLVESMMTEAALVPPLGLHVSANLQGRATPTYEFAPLMTQNGERMAGLILRYWGIDFNLLIDPGNASVQGLAASDFYRPTVLDIDGPKRTSRIILSWNSFSGGRAKRAQVSVTEILG